MKILKDLKINNESKKINASEIAVADESNKFKTLDNKLASIDDNITSLKLKKMWENDNKNASFASQNITLSSDDYDFLIWFYSYTAGATQTGIVSMMSLKELPGVLLTIACATAGDGGKYYTTTIKRDVTKQSDTVYSISGCERSVGISPPKQNENNYCIPFVVYGGKF